MNRKIDAEMEDELRPEYDFSIISGGVRGKYVERYRTGTNLVLLDSDVAQAFPTEDSVNEALRLLMQVAKRQPANQSLEPNVLK
jgi:ribosome biogenesis SPOUT family RNA methylase Rps3